ncbi:MAG TPA: two-component regulator propeller domain-containing protein [Acidobacteriaceae bacterium]|nr:two-component regulator propeller domain-containing protein [Acidobacteriaceae bacterium]
MSTPPTDRAAGNSLMLRMISKCGSKFVIFLREARLLRRIPWVFLVLACSCAHSLNPDRNLSQYGLQAWQTDNGLPQNSVRAILQTRDGYMWFATREGVARFDGIDFTLYNRRNTPQLLSNDIRSLLEDREENLWISTADGLTRFRKGHFTAFTVAQGLPDNSIWNVFQDSRGKVWAITANGLAEYSGNHFISYTTRQGLSSDTISAVADGQNGTLWVATDSGMDQIERGGVEKPFAGSPLGIETIRAIATDAAGVLWIGTQNGVQEFSNGTVRTFGVANGLPDSEVDEVFADESGRIWLGTPAGLAVIAHGKVKAYTTANGLPGNQIQALYQDREGALWVGTNHGLARIRDGAISTFQAKQGLAEELILSMYEDREGSLWVGTESGGVALLKDQKFMTLTESDGLSDNLVSSVLQGPNGDMWVGTDGGGLNRYDNAHVSVYTEKQGLTSSTILSLAAGAKGNLWVGTPDGLNQMEQGRFTAAPASDLLPDQFVRSLLADSDGSLWVGTRHGLAQINGSRARFYSPADGLANDFVGALTHDGNGGLWIGTMDGLSHLVRGKFTSFTKQDGLSSDVITALMLDSQHHLWIGTNGEGLDLLTTDNAQHRIHSFSANLGLPDVIDGILEDRSGALWISSNTGIFRVLIADLINISAGRSQSLPITSFGTSDGMKIRECSGIGHPSSWKANDGTLWFSTLKGIAWIDPAKLQRNMVAPQVAIEQVFADEENMPLNGPVKIAPGHSRFAFHYAGLSYVAPRKVRYKYRLTGFDRNWIDAGTRRVAYYTNIPPGKYRFEVLAANNDGVWSTTPASFSFQLQPYFTQTYWFDLLGAVLILLLGWLIYRWRVHQVESRFRAVLAERTRIAREIHDTLAQGFVGISVQLELAAQMLSSSPQAVREQLNQTRKLVRDSLAEARSSIWNLRSNEAGSVDFASKFSSAVRARIAGKSLETNIQFTGTYRALPANVESELLKIALEAVANVLQHADATCVDINVHYESRRLTMQIQDNGVGLASDVAAATPAGHFGVIGMRERAHAIGGTFTMNSVPGGGTKISVELPLS